jgi:hypothetical protein
VRQRAPAGTPSRMARGGSRDPPVATLPRIHVEVEPYAPAPSSAIPRSRHEEGWLPVGIAGRIRLPEYSHPFVMARRMFGDEELGPDAYRLMLPEGELHHGDGEDEWMVSMPESSCQLGSGGGLIDVVTTALDVPWTRPRGVGGGQGVVRPTG